MIERHALEQLFAQYGWPMDSREFPILLEVFTSDAPFTIEITGGETYGPIVGAQAIHDFCAEAVGAQTDQRRHVITNVRVESETDRGVVATAILTLHVTENGVFSVKGTGIYRVEAVQQADGVRFASMHLQLDVPF